MLCFLGDLDPRSVVRRNLCWWRGVKLCLSDPCCRAMDRKGANAAGSSSQGRSAWNTPLQSKPQTQLDGGSSGPAGAAISTKMLLRCRLVASRTTMRESPLYGGLSAMFGLREMVSSYQLCLHHNDSCRSLIFLFCFNEILNPGTH